ncbi:hypothetical protein [Salinimonas profundi]|nr:hypothetical protein [Salinimonas profundi]
MNIRLRLLLLMAIAPLSAVGMAEESKQAKIARALSAAPDSVSAQATVMDGDGTILQEGTNGWTCLPDTLEGDKAPMCNDETWMEMMTAVGSQSDFVADKIGISYMLQGEPTGSGVSNSSPHHPNHKQAEDYVETGPHLMIIVPKALLKGITTDPNEGGPYVMWADTPYAHIMVPVALEGKAVITKQ